MLWLAGSIGNESRARAEAVKFPCQLSPPTPPSIGLRLITPATLDLPKPPIDSKPNSSDMDAAPLKFWARNRTRRQQYPNRNRDQPHRGRSHPGASIWPPIPSFARQYEVLAPKKRARLVEDQEAQLFRPGRKGCPGRPTAGASADFTAGSAELRDLRSLRSFLGSGLS